MLSVQVRKSSPGSLSKLAKATQSAASPALRFILLTSITVLLWTEGPFLCWLPEGHTPPHSVPPLSSLDFLPSPHRKHCPVATSHSSTSLSSHVKTTPTCRDHTGAASFLEDHAPCPPLFLPPRIAHLHDRSHVLLLGAQISALPLPSLTPPFHLMTLHHETVSPVDHDLSRPHVPWGPVLSSSGESHPLGPTSSSHGQAQPYSPNTTPNFPPDKEEESSWKNFLPN